MTRLKFMVFAMAICTASFAQSQTLSSDENDLRATYQAWIAAWNNEDVTAIANIASGNFGFGRDVPFPRPAAQSHESYIEGLRSYFASMDVVSYEENSTGYKVTGETGLVWGYYSQTTKQKNGPLRTVYGRQTLTFAKRDGEWKLLMYHRSDFPNEFVR